MAKRPYKETRIYCNNLGDVCPVCGGKIIHPYTGQVTLEQLDEETQCCTWGEIIDEGRSTVGYTPYCKNIHPYTLDSENHEYIHYDLVELANVWDLSLNEKIDKLTKYITGFFKDVRKDDIQFSTNSEGKLTEIKIAKPIKETCITLSLDDNNIVVKTGV